MTSRHMGKEILESSLSTVLEEDNEDNEDKEDYEEIEVVETSSALPSSSSLKDRDSYCFTILVKRNSCSYPCVYTGRAKGQKLKEVLDPKANESPPFQPDQSSTTPPLLPVQPPDIPLKTIAFTYQEEIDHHPQKPPVLPSPTPSQRSAEERKCTCLIL